MKKIFESEYNNAGSCYSTEKIYVYAIESDDEWAELESMTFKERCKYFDVYEEHGVAPGAKYHRYEFEVTDAHMIITEIVALNV